MKTFDLHCDTIMMVKYGWAPGIAPGQGRHINVEKLQQGGAYIQCFGLFASKSSGYTMDFLTDFINVADEQISMYPDILNKITRFDHLSEEKVNIVLTMEDAGSLGGKTENIEYVYGRGIRMIGFIHNQENCYGYPNSDDESIMCKGLKPEGLALLDDMNRLGIVPDVSHLNYGGFWDVAANCKGPFAASHSCAEGVHHHKRNVTDQMIRTIADKGGVIGLNFMSEFSTGNKEMLYIRDVVEQAKYFKDIGGIDCIAIGSDFDGFPNELEFKDMSGLQQIPEAFLKAGFTEDEVEKIMCKNALRMFRDVCDK